MHTNSRLRHFGPVFAALMFCLSAGAAPYDEALRQEPGLAAYWRMDGDLKDATPAGLHGKAHQGKPVFAEGAVEGTAAVLGEKAYLSFGECPVLDVDECTIELFFRVDAQATQYNPCIIAKRGGADPTRFSIHVMADMKLLALWNGKAVTFITPPDGPIALGQWYHLAVTNSRAQTAFYLDGVPCGMSARGSLFDTSKKGLPLCVGASSVDGKEKLACAVDELAIYTRALSPEDVARHVDAAGWAERRAASLQGRERQAEEEKRMREERAREKETWLEQRLAAPRLTERGAQRVYAGEYLDAISLPIGGIGAGRIFFNGRAEPVSWQIFGNYNAPRLPNTFFALRAVPEGGAAVVRALQTTPAGPFQAAASLTFRGEYPYGWFDFADPELPLQVTMEVFNPLIPFNARDSAIPCAIVRFTARNVSGKPVKASFLAAQQNAAGYLGLEPIDGRACKDYGGNRNRVLREDTAVLLHMASGASGAGDLALAALSKDASGCASWENINTLHESFRDLGAPAAVDEAGPSPKNETLDGALSVRGDVAPGESMDAVFVLAWHFPNKTHGAPETPWKHDGQQYENWWPNALAVAREVVVRHGELAGATRLYHDTVYRSNLPQWLLDRITSQTAILRTGTCFWAKDGYFGGWEGCNPNSGCCFGNCGHVWHYAQSHARLFPEIARRMREEAFGAILPDGALPFRQPKDGIACDAQCGEVLEAYREHCLCADGAWLATQWPAIRRAMDYAIKTWDADEDGVLAGSQHNTLDCNIGGSSSWLGSMYLAALEAAAKMAELQSDAAAAERFRRIAASGKPRQNDTLFNGEYYIQLPGPEPLQDYNNGCHIDQVLGQWWAGQMDLGWIYPQDRVQSGLRALLKYNFRHSFQGVVQVPRKFVDDADSGMQMIQWPHEDRPANHTLYADEVMSGFEYAAAGTMIQSGLLKEGLLVAQAVADRYDGRLRAQLTPNDCTSWGYSGNPFGDDECGKFYARAMAVWPLLLACQGFVCDGPAGHLGFKPVWQPENHVSFFSAGAGYGVFTQQRAADTQTHRIELASGTLDVARLTFEVPPGNSAGSVAVTAKGAAAGAAFECAGSTLRIRLEPPLNLKAGETLEAAVTLRPSGQ